MTHPPEPVLIATFNRTSMESKPADQHIAPVYNLLLIEPVWNRNVLLSSWYM